MRKIFGLLLFSITSTYSQDEYLDVVPYSYSFNEIGISPSEQIWIANSSGNTYHTNKFDSKWQHGPFGTTLDEIKGTAERVTFFSDNVMIISGLLNEYPSGDGWIYRSEDGGQTWNTIKYGGNDWLDAIYAHGSKAWMSGSSHYIFYTEDTGITWKRHNAVTGFDDFRVQTIYFLNDGNTGIVSSYKGNIAITKDNCKTWENIPTPLLQEKIKNVYNTRPDIDKVRILGENYIVSQLNNVLTTNASTINWKLLPDAIDFEVTENGNLYIINKDKSITLTDRNFNTI
ncbi:WD40/YVTN/BNR-like repeat-containing protein [Flavobacterium hauense]